MKLVQLLEDADNDRTSKLIKAYGERVALNMALDHAKETNNTINTATIELQLREVNRSIRRLEAGHKHAKIKAGLATDEQK